MPKHNHDADADSDAVASSSHHIQQHPTPPQSRPTNAAARRHQPTHHTRPRSECTFSSQHHPTHSADLRQLAYPTPDSSPLAAAQRHPDTRNPSPPLLARTPTQHLKRNSTPATPRSMLQSASVSALASPYTDRMRRDSSTSNSSSAAAAAAAAAAAHGSTSNAPISGGGGHGDGVRKASAPAGSTPSPTRTDTPANGHLAHYTLGDCLGRGAFGSVFRGLNWMTGETVAVKQIKLGNIPKSELGEIMSEIDLLKNLNHPNIVKYKGSEKTRDYLYIILEYCENGSLHNICKRFGKFPEGLVGVYVSQVLDGLLYLHEQGVIHRDIKGANILTNKDGSVKLADFGVATKTGAMNDYAVVGSPYWMAPEVIDQSGATTASDIWSVGCVVVELLEGKPPYHYLAPMPALFRIVQDDYPPLPDGASPIVKDFLLHCFQKDANLRVSARKLLKHPWMVAARRQLDQMKTGGSLRGLGATVHDEAVKSVREWNEALQEPAKAPASTRINDAATVRAPVQNKLRRVSAMSPAGGQDVATARPGMLKPKAGMRPTLPVDFSQQEADEGVSHHDGDVASRKLSTLGVANGTNPLPQQTRDAPASPSVKLPLAGAAPAPSLMDQRSKLVDLQRPEDESDNWDDDFEEDITTTKIAALEKGSHLDDRKTGPLKDATNSPQKPTPSAPSSSGGSTPAAAAAAHADYDQQTIRPSPALRSVSSLPQVGRPKLVSLRPALPSASPSQAPEAERARVDDYSDLVEDGDESHLNERVRNLKLQNSLGRRLFHPDDLKKLSRGEDEQQGAPPLRGSTMHLETDGATVRSRGERSPQSTTVFSPISPTASRANSLRAGKDDKWKEMRSALGKYSEDHGDEDYSDVFGKGSAAADMLNLPEQAPLQLTMRLSQRSWLGDDRDDEEDPFAEIDEGLDAEADMEANVARDKHARMCSYVSDLVDSLSPGSPDKELLRVCEQIDQVLTDMPEMKTQLLGSHGALALIQLLEISTETELVTRLLGILNLIIFDDPEAQENLCLIGAIPVVMNFTTKKWSHELRLEAAHFVFAMCSTSRLTLQFVLSCRGLRTLVDLIDEDYADRKDLVWIGVGCVSSVLELQSPASRTDFCRMLAQEGLLEPLSTALLSVLRDAHDPYAQQARTHILQIILIFSQSDNYLKRSIATRSVLRKLLQTSSMLDAESLTQMLKIIKNLTMNPAILDDIQNANTIEILTEILTQHHEGPYGTEMSNQVLNAMYNLCRLSKSRQEEAAQSGIIPQLLRVARTKSPLKQFALPILCDLAHSGKGTRKLLWQHRALQFYVQLLEDPYWQVSALESIHVWLQDETHRVEEVLLQSSSIDSLLCLFATSKANSFENLLEPYLKICRLSNGITIAMGKNPAFLRKLVDRLKHPKAVVRLNLLRITKMVCDVHPERNTLIQQFSLFEIIDKLSKHDGAVLVRELARDILSQRYMQPGPRTVRRTMSDVGSSPSTPTTLTPRSHLDAGAIRVSEMAQELRMVKRLHDEQQRQRSPSSHQIGFPMDHGSPKPRRRLPLPDITDAEAWRQDLSTASSSSSCASSSSPATNPSSGHDNSHQQSAVVPRRPVLRDRSASPIIVGGVSTGGGARPGPRSLVETFSPSAALSNHRTPSLSPRLRVSSSGAGVHGRKLAPSPTLLNNDSPNREDQERTMRPPSRPPSRRPIPSLPDTGAGGSRMSQSSSGSGGGGAKA